MEKTGYTKIDAVVDAAEKYLLAVEVIDNSSDAVKQISLEIRIPVDARDEHNMLGLMNRASNVYLTWTWAVGMGRTPKLTSARYYGWNENEDLLKPGNVKGVPVYTRIGSRLYVMSIAAKRYATPAEDSLESKTPADLDAEWYPLMAERYGYYEMAHRLRLTLAKTIWPAEFKERYERYLGRWDKPVAYALDLRYGGERYVADHLKRLTELEAKLDDVNARMAPYQAEWDRRGGWTRYILVGGGKIHTRHEACGTLRPTTQRLILTEASGMTDDEVVARYSYTACSICFKDAPVA